MIVLGLLFFLLIIILLFMEIYSILLVLLLTAVMRVLTSPTTNKRSASSRREIWHFLYRNLAYVCSMPNIILSPCVVISNKFQIYTNYVLINVWQIQTVFHVKKKFLFFLSDNSIGKNNLRHKFCSISFLQLIHTTKDADNLWFC